MNLRKLEKECMYACLARSSTVFDFDIDNKINLSWCRFIDTNYRKLHRAAKQKPTLQKPTLQKPTSQKPTLEKPTLGKPTLEKPTLIASDDESDPQETHQEADRDGETHPTENGTGVDGEQEVPCNGDPGGASSEMQSGGVPVVKHEPEDKNYENSLEGLQKMLGYNISEEVEKQKDEGSNKKKKKHLSESSDADGKAAVGRFSI